MARRCRRVVDIVIKATGRDGTAWVIAHSSNPRSSIMRQFPAWAAALALTAVPALRARAAAAALFAVALAWATPQADAQRIERGLLWRIEGGGAPASHVFDTLHVDDPRVTKLPQAVAREFNEA